MPKLVIGSTSCRLAVIFALLIPSLVQAGSLDEELDTVRRNYGLPALAAAVVKDGTIVAAAAVGVRMLGSDAKVGIDDRFHLGSDTKAMTAALAGMLVDAGRLSWNATIGGVLGAEVPGLNPQLAAVTLEELLSHCGGVPSDTAEIAALYFSPEAFQYNLRPLRLRLLAAWKDHAPEAAPGTQFHYSNLGYTFAGAMIEQAAAMPWEELISRRLFDPLGLRTAGLGPQATRGRLDAPVGHSVNHKGEVTPMPWGPAADVPPVLGPAGVAHMSILDFARWAGWNAAQGQRGPVLLKAETFKHLHQPRIATGPLPNPRPGTPQEGAYALGWGVVKLDWAPTPVLTHSGSNGMNFANILVDPEHDLAIVVTTNFPEQKAATAVGAITEGLYRQYGPQQH